MCEFDHSSLQRRTSIYGRRAIASVFMDNCQIVLEPEGHNTPPAIALAAFMAAQVDPN